MTKKLTALPIIVYDLETQNTFEDVGGQEHTDKLKISVAGVWDYQDQTLKCYREGELQTWLPKIKRAELIIGFNSKNFDHIVLRKYFPDYDLNQIKHLDILEQVYKKLGFRLKLQSLVETTLGEGKSGSGLDAIEYYRMGDFASLEKYCLDDVRLTRDLFEYGVRHGEIWFMEGERPRSIPVDWDQWIPNFTREATVKDLVNQAHVQGKKLHLTVLELPPEKNGPVLRPEWTVDVLQVRDYQTKLFIHELNQEKTLHIARIFSAEFTGETAAVQGSLF